MSKMTKLDIAKINILKRAKKHLKKPKNVYGICNSVQITTIKLMSRLTQNEIHYAYSNARCDIICAIADSLEGGSFLENWLIERRNFSVKDLHTNPNKLLQTRLSWIDDMINNIRKDYK